MDNSTQTRTRARALWFMKNGFRAGTSSAEKVAFIKANPITVEVQVAHVYRGTNVSLWHEMLNLFTQTAIAG